MQFGISATPLIFQEAINSVLRDIPYVCAYQDDVLISAPTKNIHDDTLQKVKERLTDNNFRLNMRKCQIGLLKVNFLGFLLVNGKLLPNPEHLLASLASTDPSLVNIKIDLHDSNEKPKFKIGDRVRICHAGYFLILVVRDDLNKTCIKLMRVHLVHLIM